MGQRSLIASIVPVFTFVIWGCTPLQGSLPGLATVSQNSAKSPPPDQAKPGAPDPGASGNGLGGGGAGDGADAGDGAGLDASGPADFPPAGGTAPDGGSGAGDPGSPPGGAGTPGAPLIYALKIQLDEDVKLPLIGKTPTTFELLARVEAHVGSGTLQLVTQFCDVKATSNAPIQFTFPDAAIAAFPIATVTATLASLTPGAKVVTPPVVQLVSWQSNDPAHDRLPTSGHDHRVLDADNDGRPGVTANVSGLLHAKVGLVARANLQLTGTIESLAKITGTVDGLLEQSIVSSSSPLVPTGGLPATKPDAAKGADKDGGKDGGKSADKDADGDTQQDPPQQNTPQPNTFTMLQVSDPANACADIKARAATLFP